MVISIFTGVLFQGQIRAVSRPCTWDSLHACVTFLVLVLVTHLSDACGLTNGQDIASLGSPDWSNPSVAASLGRPDGKFGPEFSERGVVKGSPVVPGSTQRLLEEGDMCLYTITVLKGQYQVCSIHAFGGGGIDQCMK